MRVAFLHTHVVEDLGRFGISRDSYPRHFGYEHKYARLINRGPWRSSLLTFSRELSYVEVLRHVWGHEIVLVPLRGSKGARYLRNVRSLSRVLGASTSSTASATTVISTTSLHPSAGS